MTPPRTTSGTVSSLACGVLAGLVGTGVMTAFQELVEMPVTRRSDSYAPADLVEAALRVHPTTPAGRDRLNWAAHFGFGGLWGAAYGAAARTGLRGQRGVHAVFAVLYPADVVLAMTLGVYHPRRWTRQDWLVDIGNKYVALQATGLVHDRLLARSR